MTLRMSVLAAILISTLAVALPASAVLIGGVEFPGGAASFADAVVSYTPGVGTGSPSDAHRGAFNGIDVPDYAGDNTRCASQAACTFVSLGDGGTIVLRVDDNKLTGSGTAALDLWVFEVGPDVEDTFVDISKDGIGWHTVGKVFGSTAGIDIDAFGFGPTDLFAFVRLTDDTDEGAQTGITVGADIDAVGASSTVLTPVPEPGRWTLMAAVSSASPWAGGAAVSGASDRLTGAPAQR